MKEKKNKVLSVQKPVIPPDYPEKPSDLTYLQWYTKMFREGKIKQMVGWKFSDRLARLKQRSMETRSISSRKKRSLSATEQYMKQNANRMNQRFQLAEDCD